MTAWLELAGKSALVSVIILKYHFRKAWLPSETGILIEKGSKVIHF
jgi:hypothetical protein